MWGWAQPWLGTGHPENYINSIINPSSTPLQASEHPQNLTRVTFYMVPGPPACSYLKRSCPERWKAGEIWLANQCPDSTTDRTPCVEETVFGPGCQAPSPCLLPPETINRVPSFPQSTLMTLQKAISRTPSSAYRPDTLQQFPEIPNHTKVCCWSYPL